MVQTNANNNGDKSDWSERTEHKGSNSLQEYQARIARAGHVHGLSDNKTMFGADRQHH